jgi:hypothetical protein
MNGDGGRARVEHDIDEALGAKMWERWLVVASSRSRRSSRRTVHRQR